MKNIGKTVGVIALVIVVVGAICVGVGVVTGVETAEIYKVISTKYAILDHKYNFQAMYTSFMTALGIIF